MGDKMVDTHYDLLSICYVCYLNDDYTRIEKISKKIKANNNIKCIFANLYFLNKEEMKRELHENYYNSNVSVLDMFSISKKILKSYLPEIDFIYSIEGCDYVDIEDLELLYGEGLNSIILVWNNENKYGSGNRTNKGLTKEGEDFLNKAINLGIGIDLSHANISTFYGIIDVIKKNQKLGKDVICYASHSNSKVLCNCERNLTDEQLKLIKEVNGLVGVFSNKDFVTKKIGLNIEKLKIEYIKHIIYISNIVGINNIMISTDDMSFYDSRCKSPIFDYNTIVKDNEELLFKYFSLEDSEKILYKNCYDRIINKVCKKCKYK